MAGMSNLSVQVRANILGTRAPRTKSSASRAQITLARAKSRRRQPGKKIARKQKIVDQKFFQLYISHQKGGTKRHGS
jgi:hypothetical protein